jgi:hypothetical protein
LEDNIKMDITDICLDDIGYVRMAGVGGHAAGCCELGNEPDGCRKMLGLLTRKGSLSV